MWSSIRGLVQRAYTGYVLILFIVSLLVCTPLFVLMAVWGHRRGRWITIAVVRCWSKIWLAAIGMRLRVSGDFPSMGRYIIVANHISYLDTINVWAAIPARFRTLAKAEMGKIPLFGVVYSQVAIMVERGSPQSRGRSMMEMRSWLKDEGHIAIFPEGTFNETEAIMKELHDGAFRLAVDTQIPILPLLFPDTLARWQYSAWWRLWPGRNRAHFLAPVAVAGLDRADIPRLKEDVKASMAEGLKALREA